MRTAALSVTLGILLAGCGSSAAPAETVETFALPNGLTVLLRPAPGGEKVALVVLFSIGNLHDPQGQSGMGHLIEHCYVTAAAGKTASRDIQQYVGRYPDGWNAQTGDDYTVLACMFRKDALEEELRDAAARMADLRVAEADLAREKPRLLAELANMYGRIPLLAARNLAREKACPSPPGGRKGGTEADVTAMSLEAVRDRLTRYYKPKNATLVLAGGFDAPAARKAIERHFSPLPSGKAAPPPRKRARPVVPSTETIRARPLQPQMGPAAAVAYAAPAPGDAHYAAFLVLVARLWTNAAALAGGATMMPVAYAPLDDPSVITIGVPPKGNSEQAVQAIETFVTETVGKPFSAGDVALARQAFGFFLLMPDPPDVMVGQNPYGAAFALGRRHQMRIDAAALGKAVDSLTADDLRRAAETVFGPKSRAAVIVTPPP